MELINFYFWLWDSFHTTPTSYPSYLARLSYSSSSRTQSREKSVERPLRKSHWYLTHWYLFVEILSLVFFYLLKFWACHCFLKLLFIFWCLLIFNCCNDFFLPRPLLYIFLLLEFFLARLLLIIEILYCPLIIPLSSPQFFISHLPSFIIGISFLVQFFILLFSSSTTSLLLGSFLFEFLFFHWYLCRFFYR